MTRARATGVGSQLVFDSFLLMAVSRVSMVDSRDALLAADMIRFGGANQDLLWNAFAKRGLGEGASSNGAGDANPMPSFASPFADEATVTFRRSTRTDSLVPGAKLFVGDYQARAVPVADTDPATPLTDQVSSCRARTNSSPGPGRGHVRVGPVSYKAGRSKTCPSTMPHNLASSAAGATVTGDGINLARIVDDDEATNWASLGSPVAGKQVTVDLAGGSPAGTPGPGERTAAAADHGRPRRGTQGRFSALRQFRVLACRHKARSTVRTRPISISSSRARRTPSRRSRRGRGRRS